MSELNSLRITPSYMFTVCHSRSCLIWKQIFCWSYVVSSQAFSKPVVDSQVFDFAPCCQCWQTDRKNWQIKSCFSYTAGICVTPSGRTFALVARGCSKNIKLWLIEHWKRIDCTRKLQVIISFFAHTTRLHFYLITSLSIVVAVTDYQILQVLVGLLLFSSSHVGVLAESEINLLQNVKWNVGLRKETSTKTDYPSHPKGMYECWSF